MTATKIDLKALNVNPTGDGIIGFSNFAETWNGRMAMIGFAAGLANEIVTGKGILAQIGITGAGGLLVALFLTGFTIATMVGYYAIKVVKLEETATPQESAS
ncbi:chlorophyll A-B binding protein [Tumidithrix helvetica PCC 7403]|uniref:Chlorophyll A-B binding protein n=1 Tax=Tumidithrix elongata BACA0141 TaxID=2716417 RepID=A0AAW9Q238_9CYAN|nr:chlorophyll A-B binding protein [Tumidithrix elongata RA019]